jgi:hypothetical protein
MSRLGGIDARPADDAAHRDHDCVVRVADHRQEVRDQVDRAGQIDHQQREPDPHAARQALVGQPFQQSQQVRRQAHHLRERPDPGAGQQQGEQQRQPHGMECWSEPWG